MTTPTVRFGDFVAWYRNADANQQPKIAIVDLVQGDVICLEIINGKRLEGVRHVSDPEATRIPKMASQLGAWDTLANHRRVLDQRESAKLQERERAVQMQQADNEKLEDEFLRMDDMIVELHEKGMPTLEIAKTIARQGGFSRATVTLSRINKVLREAGAAAPIG